MSAALLTPPVGGGGKTDDDGDDETEEVELLVAADDDVVILRNAKRWSDACLRRCSADRIARTLLPSSHVRYMDDTDPKDWNGSHIGW